MRNLKPVGRKFKGEEKRSEHMYLRARPGLKRLLKDLKTELRKQDEYKTITEADIVEKGIICFANKIGVQQKMNFE